MKRHALALLLPAAAGVFVTRSARADEGPPQDPTKEWPVHFDPVPKATPPTPPSESADDLWQRKIHRHRVEGTLGFAATYGAAAASGALFTGLVVEHDRKNPGSDSSAYLKLVSVPLFTPVIGPIFLGGLVAVIYTAALLDTGSAYLGLGVAMAPLAYGFSTLAIADGIMQGVFLKQAFGGSDPLRAPFVATRSSPTAGPRLLAVSPMLVPEVQAPTWVSASPARGLPSALGVQLPWRW